MGTASSSSRKTKPETKKPDLKARFRYKSDVVVTGKISSEMRTSESDTKPRASSEGTDTASSIFRNEDLVIEIMTLLGVRSMVTFGSCSKSLKDGLGREIKRRKKVFKTCKNQVKTLLKNANPSYAKVLHVERIRSFAEKLVDDELDFLQIPRQRFLLLPRYPFKDEAKQFFVGNPENDDRPEFSVLPLCFYFSENGGPPFLPTTRELGLAMDRALNIVHLQDCSRQLVHQNDPYYGNPKYPFRKFEHSRANFFRKIMLIAANHLKYDIRAREAFRIAAKGLVLSRPYAQDCLHFVLHSADLKPEDDSL